MRNLAPIFIILSLFIFVAATPVRATDRLVPLAYSTIQEAIEAAQAGDMVKVAMGTYQENIVMKEGVSLQGGYSADFSTRDIILYVTIIDGRQKGTVVRFESITSASIDGFTVTNGKSELGGGINCVRANPSILNNTIKGNYAADDGGGIRCYRSNPTIANNAISGNEANYGGGILCYESDPQISNNTITSNKAGGDGGGIECYKESNAIISGNTLTGNEAGIDGGGVVCYTSNPTISNNTITGNNAGDDGGGIWCYDQSSPIISNNTITSNQAVDNGGGVYCYESSPQISGNAITSNKAGGDGGGIECYEQSNAIISANTITGNEAGAYGGGILAYESSPEISMNTIMKNIAGEDGGGIECYSEANPMISKNTISANKAGDDGGGICCYQSSPQILNNTIINNMCDSYGGGIVAYQQSNPSVANNIISKNEAGDAGGGMYFYASSPRVSNNVISGNRAFSYGGAIWCSSSSPTLSNCTIVRNIAADYGSVYVTTSSFPQIASTIFWQNDDDVVYDFSSAPGVTYSDIIDGRVSGHNGNISADPLFVDIEAGDYRLSSGSPCINAGDPSADQKDPDGSRNNMGAFGGPGAAGWGTDVPIIPVPYKEASYWEDLGLYGGQVVSLAIDPVNSSRIFATSWMGDGLFVTADGGVTWQTVEGFRNQDCYWVGMDPQNSNRIWVTYNHFVALSIDGGASWSKWRLPDSRLAHSGAIDPGDSNTVYVGTGGTGGSAQNGTVFKTEDGGGTWTQSSSSLDKTVTYLTINPSNHQEVWAMTGYNESGSVYRSRDGGNAWEKVDIGYTDERVYKMVIPPEKPLTVYISGGFGVMKTSDGGINWENVGIRNACNGLAMDPSNSNNLYASTTYAGSGNYFYRSLDGGASWTRYTIGFNAFRCLRVDPGDSITLYGGDGNLGVFKSGDRGATWSTINQGIRANIVRDSAVDPGDMETILAGTQGGLFKREQGGEWKQLTHDAVYCVAYDPQDSNTIYVGQEWSLLRTTDYGKTWKTIDVSSSSDAHRVSSIAVDPRNRNAVFIGIYYYSGNRGEIYGSSDTGETLHRLKVFDKPVNIIKIDPANSQVVYAGTGMFYVSSYDQRGGIYKSGDGGTTWSTPLLEDVVVNSIDIDPVNTSVLYAGCGHSGDEYYGLFKSVDGGLTWEEKDFDPASVTEIKINPSRNNILYAATYRRGMYMSIDSGENWTNIGLSDYKMLDLSFSQASATPSSGRRYGQSESIRSLCAGTNSGISAFTGSSISGWICDSSGTTKIYPAQVWLDVGQGQYQADVFDTGAYLILYPPVGDNYTIFCTAEGYSQGQGSGISVGAMSDISYDFHLSASAVPDAPTLTAAVSGTTVTISWTQVSAATGYKLYYAPYPYGGPDTIGSGDMGCQTGISVPLWKGASFYVAVTAYNSVGSSGYSNIAHFVVQ